MNYKEGFIGFRGFDADKKSIDIKDNFREKFFINHIDFALTTELEGISFELAKAWYQEIKALQAQFTEALTVGNFEETARLKPIIRTKVGRLKDALERRRKIQETPKAFFKKVDYLTDFYKSVDPALDIPYQKTIPPLPTSIKYRVKEILESFEFKREIIIDPKYKLPDINLEDL